jgi:hypothetical protein
VEGDVRFSWQVELSREVVHHSEKNENSYDQKIKLL